MDPLIQLCIYILLLPLLSFAVQIFFSGRLPRQGDFIASGVVGLSLVLSLYVAAQVIGQWNPNYRLEWHFTWVDFGNVPGLGELKFKLGILLDNLTAIMLVVVTGISFLVHVFSMGYMEGEPRYGRYFGYLGIFTFSMLGIVLVDNFYAIYCFWELVGLSSYLLIGFYFERDSATNAQNKAFFLNRVGDIGFWLGILILYSQFKTFNYTEIYSAVEAGKWTLSEGWLTAAGILLFMGCVGKSAQFPLHTWLPDAMEGPTPVSALIHAATMVAAGVYLLARVFVILTVDALHVIAIIGAVTAFFAATIAITQNDIKRVLAYSTLSQLGYMVMGMGVGAFAAAFFHLVTHAFFKAGLFLGSGSVIHAAHHEQDMRYMGGLRQKMPITFATFTICLFALSGIPLFTGFLSKDAILAGALGFASVEGGAWAIVPILGFGAALLTPFYMGRQWFMVFFGENRAHKKPASAHDEHHHGHSEHQGEIHESSWVMTAPLVVLALFSLWFVFSPNPFSAENGWFLSLIKTPETLVKFEKTTQPEAQRVSESVFKAVSFNEGTPQQSADHSESHKAAHGESRQAKLEHAAHEAHSTAVTLSISLALIGLLLATLVYHKGMEAVGAPFEFLSKAMTWFNNLVPEGVIVSGGASFGKSFSNLNGLLDKNVVDGIVNLAGMMVQIFGIVLRKLQTGRVQTYIVIALLAMMTYFVFALRQ
ncbi:MAG: NADH-quinone oxidoreductase subunit L [Chloroherpetonaceae bacterium]|nr:NADH-quinone oxidoreductase subunit L [Chloroherpetonaceae bacterium]